MFISFLIAIAYLFRMGHNRVRPEYVQAKRAVISSGIPVALLAGNVN